jgi:hypothetical protein
MPLDQNATTIREVEKTFMRILRDNLYDGEELVVVEPFNGSRPKKPYASVMTVFVHAEPHEVYGYEERDNDELWEAVKGERYCRLRIQFFNTGSRQKAVDCQNLLRSSNRNFDMAAIMGLGQVGDVQTLTTEYLGKQEERAYMDVEFYANMSAEYLSNNIEIVKGDIVRDGKEALPYITGGDSCKATFGPNKGK